MPVSLSESDDTAGGNNVTLPSVFRRIISCSDVLHNRMTGAGEPDVPATVHKNLSAHT